MDHRTAAVFFFLVFLLNFQCLRLLLLLFFLVQSLVYQHHVFSMVFLRIFKIFFSDLRQM